MKKVWGIGPKLEKTLNRLGITTFAQIGHFTADDIERISHALDFFPGRIIRDGWVDGAAKEIPEKIWKETRPMTKKRIYFIPAERDLDALIARVAAKVQIPEESAAQVVDIVLTAVKESYRLKWRVN